jgi:hypothetical protein
VAGILEALERQIAGGNRWVPREIQSSLKVVFVAEASGSAPEERRNRDFVDSIAKAMSLSAQDYLLSSPRELQAARLWIFFGDLPIHDVRAEKIIKTEVIGKLIDSVPLKKDLWSRLKGLKDSGFFSS